MQLFPTCHTLREFFIAVTRHRRGIGRSFVRKNQSEKEKMTLLRSEKETAGWEEEKRENTQPRRSTTVARYLAGSKIAIAHVLHVGVLLLPLRSGNDTGTRCALLRSSSPLPFVSSVLLYFYTRTPYRRASSRAVALSALPSLGHRTYLQMHQCAPNELTSSLISLKVHPVVRSPPK